MKLDITKYSYDAEWEDFKDGARLKIKPWIESEEFVAIEDGQAGVSGKKNLQRFLNCLEDWDGITGADGKPLPCTDEVKKVVFDFNIEGIPVFVLRKSMEFRLGKERAEKNLQTGSAGPSKKTR